ncbi:MAG: DUF3137 domain-containing protein, partial [Chitinophagales bacterium]
FLVVYFIFFGSARKRFDFKKAYKEKAIKKLIAFILPTFTHTSFQYIPHKVYNESKICLPAPAMYTGEDYVQGLIGDTSVEFSEILAQEVITDNKGRTQYSTVFNGLFFISSFKRNFTADTYIFGELSDKFQETFEKLFHDINILRPERVKTGNAGMDTQFMVYSTDAEQAGHLFTKEFMELITVYKERKKADVQIALHKERVYIAVPLPARLFNVSLYKSVLKNTDTEEYFSAVKFCFSVLDALKNNPRIWT